MNSLLSRYFSIIFVSLFILFLNLILVFQLKKNSIHQPVVKAAYRSIRKLTKPADMISSTYEPSIERYLRPDATAAENPRADIIVRLHITSKDVLLDFTFPVIKPSTPNNMSTVKKAETDKNNYYQKNFDLPNNLKFIPCAIDTYGKWGDELKSWVKRFCNELTTNKAEYVVLISELRDDICNRSRQSHSQADSRLPRSTEGRLRIGAYVAPPPHTMNCFQDNF